LHVGRERSKRLQSFSALKCGKKFDAGGFDFATSSAALRPMNDAIFLKLLTVWPDPDTAHVS